MSDSYSEQLVVELRLRGVPGQRIGQVVAEVEAYTADSGEDPVEAFGPVDAYAGSIVAELRSEPAGRSRTREILGAYPPAVGSLVLFDGLLGTIDGGRAALTVGDVVVAALLPLAALLLVAAVLRARRWAYLAVGSTAVAGGAVLWAGNGLVLVRYPAWIGLVGGAVLLFGGLRLVLLLSRDPVVDPRTGRDRYPEATAGPLRRLAETVRRRRGG